MIEIYILETCPFCQKVMNFMDEHNINYKKINILEDDNLTKLISLGGKEQVPYIYNTETDEGLYESGDIINYLENLG